MTVVESKNGPRWKASVRWTRIADSRRLVFVTFGGPFRLHDQMYSHLLASNPGSFLSPVKHSPNTFRTNPHRVHNLSLLLHCSFQPASFKSSKSFHCLTDTYTTFIKPHFNFCTLHCIILNMFVDPVLILSHITSSAATTAESFFKAFV